MKIALATTTIHVPHALKLLRKCSPFVKYFIAVDEKTPQEVLEMPEAWHGAGWKCSEALGWNTIARRNIAFLEALQWGADIIYSWDDDNIPLLVDHFWQLQNCFAINTGKSGLLGSSHSDWFDPGQLLFPNVRHRGIPHEHGISVAQFNTYNIITDARIGIAAGLVLGDPDIDATTRMERHPDIQVVSEAARSGVVVALNTHTVFNTQNTAVIRELIPAWFLMPGVGRHDDIYASLIVQRVARERSLHVHFGQPFVYQQRNEHDLTKDLRAEIDGMANVARLAKLLDSIVLPAKSVIEDVAIIYDTLAFSEMIPRQAIEAARLWLDDCEEAMVRTGAEI